MERAGGATVCASYKVNAGVQSPKSKVKGPGAGGQWRVRGQEGGVGRALDIEH